VDAVTKKYFEKNYHCNNDCFLHVFFESLRQCLIFACILSIILTPIKFFHVFFVIVSAIKLIVVTMINFYECNVCSIIALFELPAYVSNVTEKLPNNVSKKNCIVICNVITVMLYFYNVTV
jgi:hypothetical protein